jgi:hypothetical protein
MGCMKSGSVITDEYVLFFIPIVTHLLLLLLLKNITAVLSCMFLCYFLYLFCQGKTIV